MVKHYKESPWWWYAVVLVVSFVLGLVVVIKENITLSAWAYVVALLLGIFIAPLVGEPPAPQYNRKCQLSNHTAEYPSLLSLRQRHRYEQPVKDASWPAGPRAPHWEHVLRRLVPQCHFQRGQPL